MTLKVEPIPGHPTWLYVEGKSEPWYQVELEELDGNGWCSCHDFYNRHYPAWQAAVAAGVPKPMHRCKHIVVAREWFLDVVISRMAQAAGNGGRRRTT